ncbi:MAG: hypothetical protein AAF205_09495, partial [Pseudomonadota bacterium]
RATLENSGIPFTRFRLMSFRPRYFKMAARVLPATSKRNRPSDPYNPERSRGTHNANITPHA